MIIAFALTAQGCAIFPVTPDRSTPPVARVDPVARPKIETPKVPSASATVHIGQASWYGPGFHGRKTASGDVFDQNKFTAAHRTFPLGSRARVTHLESGRTVEVEINDRGPYAGGRIIDLSQAAARALGIIENGTARVRVELISPPASEKAAHSR